jgi:hypothetical protein
MTDLPYALGCPSCTHFEVVSEADPDASVSELSSHIFNRHADYDYRKTNELLNQARDLTEMEVAR